MKQPVVIAVTKSYAVLIDGDVSVLAESELWMLVSGEDAVGYDIEAHEPDRSELDGYAEEFDYLRSSEPTEPDE